MLSRITKSPTKAEIAAGKIVAPYLIVTLLWLTFSTIVTEHLVVSHIFGEALFLFGGVFYAAVTSTLLFLLVRRLLTHRDNLHESRHQVFTKCRDIVSSISDVVWECDSSGIYTYVSPSCQNMYGCTPGEMLGRPILSMVAAEHEYVREVLCSSTSVVKSLEVVCVTKYGHEITVEMSVSPIVSDAGVVGFRGMDRDVSERKKLESNLRQTILEQKVLLDNSLIGIAFLSDRKIVRTNDKFAKMLGYKKSDLIGRSCHSIFAESNPERCNKCISDLADDVVHTEDALISRADGTTFWGHVSAKALNPGNPSAGTVLIVQDVTDRKKAEKEITRLAYYDSLTNLPNRMLMKDRLSTSISHAIRHKQQVGLLFIDLDNFKYINDAFGHGIGDKILYKAANRLQDSLRASDTVARVGGDEFVVIVSEGASEDSCTKICLKILDAFSRPFFVEDREMFITPSIGVALFPDDSVDIDTLIKHSDVAMYKAKEAGRSTFKFYSPDLETSKEERIQLETDLRYAIERHEFFMVYQPWYDIAEKKIGGFEALCRWQHPERGVVPPDKFIPIAEETGLIVELGELIMSMSFADAKMLEELGFRDLTISVNISPRQFKHEDIIGSVTRSIETSGISSENVELELTENCIMSNTEESLMIIEDFVKYGLRISIDDFGTGYSSLSYLKHFPVDRLKIDKSFVDGVVNDEHDSSIVKVIIALAKTMDLRVIGEGVECLEQLEFLRDQGADEAQGYFICRPLKYDSLVEFLDRFDGESLLSR